MIKQYFYKIYELKNGSRRPKLLCEENTAASNKQEAFKEAKNALFRFVEFEFNTHCVKKEFEDIYLQAKKNKNFKPLQDLEHELGYWGVYDADRLGGFDDLTTAVFTRGDSSYSYCIQYSYYRDAYTVYLKVFAI